MQAKYPHRTIWNVYAAPYVQAIAAMAAHKPREAIAVLERSRPLEGRDFGHQMLRADAYLAAGEAHLAENEYRGIISQRKIYPVALEVPLSWLV